MRRWVLLSRGLVARAQLQESFEVGATVDEKALRAAGLVRGTVHGVKILATGDLKKKLSVHADSVSDSAKEKIEKAGGSFTLTAAAK